MYYTIFKKIKKKDLYFLFILGVVGIFYLVNQLLNPGRIAASCEEEKNMSFKGVVVDIVQDSVNLSQSFIFLEGGQKILLPRTYGLWIDLDIGDSIVKEKGSFDCIIYPIGNEKRVFKSQCPLDK